MFSINEKEAEIVKRIFNEYLEGKSFVGIAKGLEKDNILTAAGNKKWWDSTVAGILANEKYTSMECYATKQKTSDVEYVMENIEPNIVHNNFFWSVQNENDEVEYVIKDNKTIVFEVPKLNSDGESTINEELKVLCKIKK